MFQKVSFLKFFHSFTTSFLFFTMTSDSKKPSQFMQVSINGDLFFELFHMPPTGMLIVDMPMAITRGNIQSKDFYNKMFLQSESAWHLVAKDVSTETLSTLIRKLTCLTRNLVFSMDSFKLVSCLQVPTGKYLSGCDKLLHEETLGNFMSRNKTSDGGTCCYLIDFISK